MIGIKFLFVLLSCYLIQVQCEVSLHSDGDDEKGIIDIAKAALHALEKTVEAVTSIALITLNTLETGLGKLDELLLKFAKEEIDELGDQIFKKLDELKQDANIYAVDIIDCTEDRENDLKQLLVTFLNKTGDCAVNRIDEVIDSLGEVITDVQNINEDVKNITAQLDICENESDATGCILQVIEDIAKAATEIPDKVASDVKEAEKRMDELVNYLFECEHDSTNELEKTSQEIFNGIVECVENKILHPTIVYLP